MHRIHHSIIAVLLSGVFLGLAPGQAQAQTYVFGTASYAAAGPGPMVAADFNGDGIPDLAVLGVSSGTSQVISIFLGKPDGTFAPRVDYPLLVSGYYDVEVSGFTVGDFTGNGKLDIVIANNFYLPPASILLGNGDGTFQSPTPLNQTIPNATYSQVASADFNGDGKLDLVFLGNNGTMLVLLGNGDGTFEAPVSYTIPASSYISIGEFNGDGKPDIALGGGVAGSYPASSEVSVLINNGDGTFQSAVNYPITGEIEALAVADLNGDGKLDLVVPTGGFSAGVSVLLGVGDGTFASPVTYTSTLLSPYSTSVAVADFNGDGKVDLALTNSEAPSSAVAILLGNGDGTFQNPPLLYSAGLDPAGVIALDVNGDGKPDLAVVGGYATPSFYSVTVLINQGNGSFPNFSTYPVPRYPYSAVVGDFNGDGKPDIAVDSPSSPGSVSVLLGNGDGTFQSHLDTAVGGFPIFMAAGDFNADGHLDLVVAGVPDSGFSTLLGNGDGTFQTPLSQTTSSVVSSLAVGDFNGDGKLDVAAVIYGTNAVSIFLGNGDGTFSAPTQYPVGTMEDSPPFHNVLVGDFNQDGIPDLAVSTDAGVSILLGKGDGTFQPYSAILPGASLITIGDFNGDGKPDLALGEYSSMVTVALSNGDGTFQQAASFPLAGILNVQSGVAGDFNGDGKLDLAFASQSSDVVTILFGNGDGTFSRHVEYAAGSIGNNLDFVVASDFNGDGALDLAWASSNVWVLLSSPVAAFFPSRLNFGSQLVEAASSAQTVLVSNPSPVPISFSSIGTAGDFSETDNCSPKLVAGASCQASVTFTPTAGGTRTGLLVFNDSAPGSPQAVTLSGTGTAPSVSLSARGLSFGSQALSTTSAAQTETVTNTGTGDLTISTVTLGGTNASDFAKSADTCTGATVTPNGTCTVSVRFTPSATGSRSASLNFTDNNNGVAGSTQMVTLRGTGIVPVVHWPGPILLPPRPPSHPVPLQPPL